MESKIAIREHQSETWLAVADTLKDYTARLNRLVELPFSVVSSSGVKTGGEFAGKKFGEWARLQVAREIESFEEYRPDLEELIRAASQMIEHHSVPVPWMQMIRLRLVDLEAAYRRVNELLSDDSPTGLREFVLSYTR